MTRGEKTVKIPAHIGIILDGNRRWAQARGLATIHGHREGARNLKRITLHAFDRGARYVSVYAFSTENWSRTPSQVQGMMRVFRETLHNVEKEYKKEGVRIRFAGRFDRFPNDIKTLMPEIEEKTASGKRGTLIICLGYGGRQEIVDALNRIVQVELTIPAKVHIPREVPEELITKNLYAPDVPDPDLIIRTGGQKRLSGFLTWQSVYSELFFVDTLWPAFSTIELDRILEEFDQRQRNFGK